MSKKLVCPKCGSNPDNWEVFELNVGEKNFRVMEFGFFCKKCGIILIRCPIPQPELDYSYRLQAKEVKTMDRTTHNVVAVVASFFIPGLGQFVKGHMLRGLVLLILGFLSACLMLLLIGFILYPIVWLVSMIDAWMLKPKGEELELSTVKTPGPAPVINITVAAPVAEKKKRVMKKKE